MKRGAKTTATELNEWEGTRGGIDAITPSLLGGKAPFPMSAWRKKGAPGLDNRAEGGIHHVCWRRGVMRAWDW